MSDASSRVYSTQIALVLALLGAFLLAPSLLFGQPVPRISVTGRTIPDELVAFDGRRQDAERTILTIVQKAHGASETTRIDVGYLRLSARAQPAKSPIVFLMGGPGVPATVIGRIPPYWSLFDRLRATADVILLDPRGVGISRPLIDCPAGMPPATDFLASHRHLRDALRATYAPCVSMWRSRGVPPELFSVAEIAADIEDIRRHLEVPRLSLLAFSHGTRLALEYVRLFPEHVDQVALQATLGFDDVIRLPTELDAVLARVSATAARDSIAHALVPDLQAALLEQFRLLGRRPLQVTTASESGGSIGLTVGGEGLQAIVAGRIGDPRIPALIASLRAGDTRLVAAMAAAIYRDLASGGGSLFGRAVYCSAPASEPRERLASRLSTRSMMGQVFDNIPAFPDFCRDIGIAPGPRAVPPSRVLDRSALFIVGTLDDRSPPNNVERARRYFTQSTVVTVENGGHELLPLDDVQAIVMEFLSTGRTRRERLTLPPPQFQTVEQALQPPRRR